MYYSSEVSLCEKDVCVNVKGDMANFIAATVFIAVVAIALTEFSKSVK